MPTEELRLTPPQAEARLSALGFADPDGALRHIERSPPGCPGARRCSARCCRCCCQTSPTPPTPTAGCSPTGGYPTQLGDTPWYLRLLRDEGAVAQR